MSGPERGGDSQWLAKAVVAQRSRFRSPRPKEPKQRAFLTLSQNPERPASSEPEVAPESVVTASLDTTVEAFVESAIVRAIEALANVAHPGLGHVISVALNLKEVWDNVNALASPDSPRDLHVPLLGAADGIELDLNVHLPGRNEAGDDAPLVSGFAAPGAEGLFGGWQIEIDRRPKAAEKEAPQSEKDTWTVLAASIAQPAAQQADQTGSHDLSFPAGLTFNLAASVPTDDPRRRAAIMREAASRLQSELYARPEFMDKAVIVIYNRAAGLGMWMAKPDPSKPIARQRIDMRVNLETGLTTAFLS